MTWLDAPKSEHVVRREHYVAGRQDERERIIALLEAKFDVTMKIATLLGHEEPEPTISLETAIALIKGEEA